MNNQIEQIIPKPDSVVRYIDTNSISNSASTSLVSELLLEVLFKNPQESWMELSDVHQELVRIGSTRDNYRDTIGEFIQEKINKINDSAIQGILEEGLPCSLLQPDGKGWQKGALKMCFEFIPEENATATEKVKSSNSSTSPLDDIRRTINDNPW